MAEISPEGTEWVTGMNSQSNDPIRWRSWSPMGMRGRAVDHPPFFEAVADQPQRERGGVDRKRQPVQRVGQRPDVILMAVGADAAHNAVGPVAQILQVGQHEIGAGHLLIGEQHPAVQQ